MKTNKYRVPTRFAPETRFNITAVPVVPFRGTQETELDRLKNQLLKQWLNNVEPEFNAPLRRAANDAASLAWLTPFPLLFFPALFDEKAAAAKRQQEKQKQVRRRSPRLLLQAA